MAAGSADVINVNFAALQASAAALSARANVLTQNLADLSAGVKPLKETWTASGSSAGTAYDQAELKLTAAINDIVNTISQFSRTVSEAHDMQRSLEAKNTGYFAG